MAGEIQSLGIESLNTVEGIVDFTSSKNHRWLPRIPKSVRGVCAVSAIMLSACGSAEGAANDDTTSTEPTTTLEMPTTTSTATTTSEATTTTAEATTTTERTSDSFPYVIPFMDVAPYDPSIEWAWANEDPSQTSIPQHAEMYDFNQEYYEPLQDNGTYPIHGRNPNNPKALTLGDYSKLAVGTAVCVRGGNGRVGADVNYKVIDRKTAPFVSPSAVVFQKLSNGGRVNYLAVLMEYDSDGGTFYAADKIGLVNYPHGGWDMIASVELGPC